MLRLLLWQRALVWRNELLRGTWRRRIGWLIGLAAGTAFVVFIFVASLAMFEMLRVVQPDAIPALVSGGFAVLLTFALFWGMGTALSDLYLSSDLELVLSAPVPRSAIFWLKLLTEMWQTGASALIPITTVVAYGVVVAASPSYYLAAAIVWLIVLATLVALSMTLVMLLMRFMPARRAREIYSLLYVILFAAMWLGWMLLSGRGRIADRLVRLSPSLISTSQRISVPPGSWAGDLMLSWANGAWARVAVDGLRLILMAAFMIAIAYFLFERSFHHDWAAMHEVAARDGNAGARAGARPRLAPGQLLANWLPWPARELAAKDWTVFPRDLRQLSRLVMPLVVSLFYVYQFGFAAPIPRAVPGVGFWMALLILPVVPIFFALAMAAPAIGKEGHNFELLRVAPLSPAALLWGKVAMAGIPTTLLAVAVTTAVSVLLRIPTAEALVLAILAALVSFAISAISVALGALTPNFSAVDYRRAAGPLAAYGTLLGGGLVWLALVLTVIAYAVFVPGTTLARGLRGTLARATPMLGELRSPLLVLGAAALDLMALAVLILLWILAVRRITSWQPGD